MNRGDLIAYGALVAAFAGMISITAWGYFMAEGTSISIPASWVFVAVGVYFMGKMAWAEIRRHKRRRYFRLKGWRRRKDGRWIKEGP